MNVERKVSAATAGAGGGTVVANFLLWVLATYAFHGPVPVEVWSFVNVVVAAAGAFGMGYLARHTPRQPGGQVFAAGGVVNKPEPLEPPAPPPAG